MNPTDLNRWFVREVLPLEAGLIRFLRRNWRNETELADLRQEVYVRIYESAARGLPEQVKPFVYTTARNMLIDRARREQVVCIETIAELDALEPMVEDLTPERHASGRTELRLLQAALEGLPPRCRRVFELRRIEGMSQRDVADHLGITEDTVERQVAKGIRSLAESLFSKGITLGTRVFGELTNSKNAS